MPRMYNRFAYFERGQILSSLFSGRARKDVNAVWKCKFPMHPCFRLLLVGLLDDRLVDPSFIVGNHNFFIISTYVAVASHLKMFPIP